VAEGLRDGLHSGSFAWFARDKNLTERAQGPQYLLYGAGEPRKCLGVHYARVSREGVEADRVAQPDCASPIAAGRTAPMPAGVHARQARTRLGAQHPARRGPQGDDRILPFLAALTADAHSPLPLGCANRA